MLRQTMSRKTNKKIFVLIHSHDLRYWAGEAGRLILRLVWLYSETLPKRKRKGTKGQLLEIEGLGRGGLEHSSSPSLWHHIYRPGSAQKGSLGVREPVREKTGYLGRMLESDDHDWHGSFDLSF